MTGDTPDVNPESVVTDFINREVRPRTDVPPVESDTSLIETGVIDSLSMLKLVMFIEEKFGIAVPPEDVIPSNFETVRRICGYIRSKEAHGSRSTGTK